VEERLVRQRVDRAFQERRFAEAVQFLEPLAWSRQDPELWNNLGVVYYQLGWQPEAEAAFRRALGCGARRPVHFTNLVDQLLAQGLPHSGMQVLRQAAAAGVPETDWQPRLRQLEEQYPVEPVAVYTPGYGCEGFLERCLRSIQGQTYPVHEVLLVDDRAPDGSTAIALRHGVRVFYHSENLGLAASCNTALEHCRGRFLAKVDSDVELSPTWLERAMLAFEDAQTAGVGGRLIEHRTATLPDQWRQRHLAQHWGLKRATDPDGLFGADCVFRVEALAAVGGWSARYRMNFEDWDLSRRLKGAGYHLVYEPRAVARHLRQDGLYDVLRNLWNWRHPIPQERGTYDSMARATGVISWHRGLATRQFNASVAGGWFDLLYPSFLLFFWFCLRDLQQVLRRGRGEPRAVSQTGLAVFLLVRHQLRREGAVPGHVAERTLEDLRRGACGFLEEAERAALASEARLDELLPPAVTAPADVLRVLREQLPAAEAAYLEAFDREPFLSGINAGTGALVGLSARAFTAEEQELRDASPTRPRYVVFNPPGGAADAAAMATRRWLRPSLIEELARRLRRRGASVRVLDAVAVGLDEEEAHERVLGTEPAAVVYTAAEGGLERLAASARRLKLTGPEGMRLLLTHAEACLAAEAEGAYPMFDEFHAGLPDDFVEEEPSASGAGPADGIGTCGYYAGRGVPQVGRLS
jgi:glycosyltransferase involved in cell wall biosynthesis